MQFSGTLLTGQQTRFALVLSVALHLLVFVLAANYQTIVNNKPELPKTVPNMVFVQVVSQNSVALKPEPEPERATPLKVPISAQTSLATQSNSALLEAVQDKPIATVSNQNTPASMAAPAAPTAQEWAFAATYTHKNSKGYRYQWGQQVRSMMGTAVEGPDQGMVRFRLEIAPDGRLTKLETLWTTSAVAEKLARQAIGNMPPLPATPTGKPLVFEKTISFMPYAMGGPPMYKNDCLPDPPEYRNPFAWDGKSPQGQAETELIEQLSPEALAECLKKLPPDSVEAEESNAKGKMDRWGWSLPIPRR